MKKILKNRLKFYLSHNTPYIFHLLYKILGPEVLVKEALISKKTEIVIEGYPRSANTFSVFAFLQAQGRHISIAHHLHVEAQIVLGVRWGIPVLVLLRNPVDAIRSLKIRHPDIIIRNEIERYIQFY